MLITIHGRSLRSLGAGIGACAAWAANAPVAQAGTYHLSYDDEFNSMPQIANMWGSKSPGYLPCDYWSDRHYNLEAQQYLFPGIDSGYNPFSVTNGVLSITAKPTPNGMNTNGQPYVSGMLSTSGGGPDPWRVQSSTPFTQQYGYFELRAKLPAGKGLWPAFWLVTDNAWPPEYDIFEVLGSDPGTIHQTSHWKDAGGNATGQGYEYKNVINSSNGFHTYGFEWDATSIRWYVDDVLTQTQANRFNDPMYVIMNLAVGGVGSWPGAPDASTVFPAQMQIDYLRVYSADPGVTTVLPQSGYDGSLPAPIATVPEPASLLSAGLGCAAMLMMRRRQSAEMPVEQLRGCGESKIICAGIVPSGSAPMFSSHTPTGGLL